MDEFSKFHPVVNLIYFISVIGIATISLNPVLLGIGLVCSVAYSIMLCSTNSIKLNLTFVLPLMIFSIIINPILNHRGITIVGYLPTNTPVTMESILYGIASAVMIGEIINWFMCFNKIITEDKFIYLFGKAAPSLAIIISMIFRFVPRLCRQFKEVYKATGSKRNFKDIGDVISIVLTKSLEDAVDTSTSMKSRGYGIKNRKSYYKVKFDTRDLITLISIILLFGIVISGFKIGIITVLYFPKFVFDLKINIFYIVYFALCVLPIFIEVKEVLVWKRLRSKI